MDKKIKIYAQNLDKETLDQFYEAMKLECNIQGALMPDAHLGYTLPIGAVVKSKNMIFPSYVGYDIGCGVSATKVDLTKEDVDLEEVKEEILKQIPLGVDRHKKAQEYVLDACTDIAKKLFDEVGKYQLGTLGGGNHFIEIGEGKDKKLWIVIHSGSRGFGKKVAEFYMRKAAQKSINTDEFEREFELKNQDFKKYNFARFEIAKKDYATKKAAILAKKNVEKHVGFDLNSKDGKDYTLDLDCALNFALENRKRMSEVIVKILDNPKKLNFINKNHNHAVINGDFVVHRKGATVSEKGVYGVVPGNMKDGSFIVKGKGNAESLCSSSHGAGRVMSRNEAQKSLSYEKFCQSMKGIVTNHSQKTLDEAPKAYKNIFEVMDMQKDLVEIIEHIRVVLNVKG